MLFCLSSTHAYKHWMNQTLFLNHPSSLACKRFLWLGLLSPGRAPRTLDPNIQLTAVNFQALLTIVSLQVLFICCTIWQEVEPLSWILTNTISPLNKWDELQLVAEEHSSDGIAMIVIWCYQGVTDLKITPPLPLWLTWPQRRWWSTTLAQDGIEFMSRTTYNPHLPPRCIYVFVLSQWPYVVSIDHLWKLTTNIYLPRFLTWLTSWEGCCYLETS